MTPRDDTSRHTVSDHARRIVAQHADTLLRLGVDNVPVSRRKPAALIEPKNEAKNEPKNEPKTDSSIRFAAASPAGGKLFDRDASQAALDTLRAQYEADAPHANFGHTFTNIVFGEGDPCACLMFIGEAPGENEDLTGRPFVGRAGDLLEKMIIAMGLSRETVYIANVLKVRPTNNATPTAEEARVSAPYLFEQINIIAPEAIVTLGLPATQTLLETKEAMGKLRANWHAFPPSGSLAAATITRPVPVMPTYHPAYLLRAYTPENRKKVWSDLRQVMQRLGMQGPA